MQSLLGRVALVTGGGRGIGRSVALALAEEGARVAVAARSAGEIASVAEEVAAAGGECIAVTLDVTSPEDVRRAVDEVRGKLGDVDILVNNAGIARSALVWKTSDELWRSTLETNLSGTFYCMREVLEGMVARRWGRVINIASVAGKVGAPYVGAYVASKHAVIGLTRSAALEVAAHGVTVNAICPGYVDTPMTDGALENIQAKTGLSLDEARKKLESMSPQNRLMTCDEIAFLTVALTSEQARGINGQAINMDGGGGNGLKREIINPEALGAPRGYSNGVLLGPGRTLFVAGQVGWNSQQQIVEGGFAAQFVQALKNVLTVVMAAGGEVEDIGQFTIYVCDRHEYVAAIKDVGEGYRSVMARHFPAMALVEVAGLLEPGARVEIEAIAIIPDAAEHRDTYTYE